MNADEHAKVVLAAIVPDRRDLLDYAIQHLTPNHFLDSTLRTLFQLIERYSEVTGAILTRDALGDLLRNQDAGKIALYLEMYDLILETPASEEAFKWSVLQMRELAADRDTAEALTKGMEILRTGVAGKKGEELKGASAARAHVVDKFAEIDKELVRQASPEGDMRDELNEMLDDYAERKRMRLSGAAQGIRFGVPALDAKIGGLQPGELDFIIGYSSDGKTSLCVQLGWSAAIEQGKNVVILTSETLRPQVRRKVLSRHSRLPQFELSEGLNSRDLKAGSLPESLEPKLSDIAMDFTKNPGYGRLVIVQIPRGATITTCEARLYQWLRRLGQVDLVIIDYLRLLSSSRRRQSEREELGAIIIEAKQMATTFDDGRGVPVISPWQVNRTKREEVNNYKVYLPEPA